MRVIGVATACAIVTAGLAFAARPEGAVKLEGAKVEGAAPPEKLPLGVSATLYAMAVPKAKAPTPEKIALGEKLFNDKRLSVDDTVSCATCHDAKLGFSDARATSEGVRKQLGQRNSPTVLNALFATSMFWDGRAATLEDQAKLPILNPIEMGMKSPEDVIAKISAIPEYKDAFQKVFGRAPTYDDLAHAIASFERTQFTGDAPFDRFIRGDEKAFGAAEKRGWALFNGKARCNQCHAGNAQSPLFSDFKFHNVGVAARKQDFAALAKEALGVVRTGDVEQIDRLALETKFSELGRFLVTKNENDVGAFKTPVLRDLLVTGPYMHDGSMETLWDVVDHYNKGGIANPFLDGGMQRLGLTESEIDDLVAFLATLTSDRFAADGKKAFAKQKAGKSKRPERDTDVAMGKKGNMGDLAPNPDKKDPSTIGVFGGTTP